MKKLYDKNELRFSLIWIVLYIVLFSLADGVSGVIGISKIVTVLVSVVMTAIIYCWICKNGLKEKYGLYKFQGNVRQYLYFIPLVLLASTNLWFGFKLNLSVLETVLYIISMMCVGFLEEVIFRGFFFKALCKKNIKYAIFISSVTFGLGHIVNLFNGQNKLETLIQICYRFSLYYYIL